VVEMSCAYVLVIVGCIQLIRKRKWVAETVLAIDGPDWLTEDERKVALRRLRIVEVFCSAAGIIAALVSIFVFA